MSRSPRPWPSSTAPARCHRAADAVADPDTDDLITRIDDDTSWVSRGPVSCIPHRRPLLAEAARMRIAARRCGNGAFRRARQRSRRQRWRGHRWAKASRSASAPQFGGPMSACSPVRRSWSARCAGRLCGETVDADKRLCADAQHPRAAYPPREGDLRTSAPHPCSCAGLS